jgi:hypothetical protein
MTTTTRTKTATSTGGPNTVEDWRGVFEDRIAITAATIRDPAELEWLGIRIAADALDLFRGHDGWLEFLGRHLVEQLDTAA